MEEKIKMILSGILETAAGEIGDDFGPDRCQNWDSLNNLRLITALEKEFNIKFSWPEISSMTDFSRIREVIARRGGGQ
jgi:acyl carrier protein